MMSAQNIEDQDIENTSNDDGTTYDESYDDAQSYTDDSSDEWSDDTDLGEDGADEDQQEPAAKKKSNTMTIIITLVVAIIGVFGFMIFSGNKNVPVQVPVADNAPINTDPDVAAQPNIASLKSEEEQKASADQDALGTRQPVAVNPAEEKQPTQGLMDNPAALEQQQAKEQAAVISKDAVVPTDTNSITAPIDNAKPNEIVENIAPEVKPVSDFPTVDAIKKPEGEKLAEKSSEEPVTLDTAPQQSAQVETLQPTPVNIDDGKLKEVQSNLVSAQDKIAELEKALSDKDAELGKIKQKVEDQSSLTASEEQSKQEVEDLKMKISDLEAKLAEKSVQKSDGISKDPKKIVVAEKSNSNINPADDVVDVKSNVSALKKRVSSPIKELKAIKRVSWALKSANSSKAVLSDKLTGDLKTVHVGDSIVGLGRITSISDASSVWVVKGTTGSVSE